MNGFRHVFGNSRWQASDVFDFSVTPHCCCLYFISLKSTALRSLICPFDFQPGHLCDSGDTDVPFYDCEGNDIFYNATDLCHEAVCSTVIIHQICSL